MENNELPITLVKYQEHEIGFQNEGLELWIDATAMAKPFGKRAYDFLKLEQAERFIEALTNAEIKKRENVINTPKGAAESILNTDISFVKTMSGNNGVTIMHRILALKFAAWLSPDFEVWVFNTIDEILNGERKEQRNRIERKANRRIRKGELLTFLQKIPEFNEYQAIVDAERREARMISVKENNQLTLFMEQNGMRK